MEKIKVEFKEYDNAVIDILNQWVDYIQNEVAAATFVPVEYLSDDPNLKPLRLIGFTDIEIKDWKINASFRGYRYYGLSVDMSGGVSQLLTLKDIDLIVKYDRKEEIK